MIDTFVKKLDTAIFTPIVTLLFALALLYFIWGVVEFILNADTSDGREKGRSHMLWGVVGMFIMFGVWGIIAVIKNSLGIPG